MFEKENYLPALRGIAARRALPFSSASLFIAFALGRWLLLIVYAPICWGSLLVMDLCLVHNICKQNNYIITILDQTMDKNNQTTDNDVM